MTFDYNRVLNVGDQTAEGDWDFLQAHFIKIGTAAHVATKKTAIILGRKGSGKSALRLHFEKSGKSSYRAATIQPSPNDLKASFEYLFDNEHGPFSVEFFASLWETCVLVNIAGMISAELGARSTTPDLGGLSPWTPTMISRRGPTSLGKTLSMMDEAKSSSVDLAAEVRSFVTNNIGNTKVHYFVLVDSVDDTLHNVVDTTKRSDLFSTFFEGLLSFLRHFRNEDRNPFFERTTLKLFIPIDVFDWSVGRHADHIRQFKHYINWEGDQLSDFITSRLAHNLDGRERNRLKKIVDGAARAAEIWTIFFPEHVPLEQTGSDTSRLTKERTSSLFISMTLRRPRDLQEIVRLVYEQTQTAGASFPTPHVIETALKMYSIELRSSVEKEYEHVLPDIHDVLSKMTGNAVTFARNTLIEAVGEVIGHEAQKISRAISILYQACVIGAVEGEFDPINPNRHSKRIFYYDLPNFTAVQNSEAFTFHRAFWHALHLKSYRTSSY